MDSSQAFIVDSDFDATRTVGGIVADKIARAEVFEYYGIDYCCGGDTPLSDACEKAKVDLSKVVNALIESDKKTNESTQEDVRSFTLTELCDHIELTHHTFMKNALPRIAVLLDNTFNAHKSNHPKLAEVTRTFQSLKTEIETHLMKEERILFPLIRQFELEGHLPATNCGIDAPIRQMELEHDDAGEALRTLSSLTNQYTPPEDACNTYKAMLKGLQEMEQDLHIHIHKENNILFPRAIELFEYSKN